MGAKLDWNLSVLSGKTVSSFQPRRNGSALGPALGPGVFTYTDDAAPDGATYDVVATFTDNSSILAPPKKYTIPTLPATGAAHLHTMPTGTLRFVSPTGSDANTGTETSPWLTIPHAVANAPVPSTVVVRGGTYTFGTKWSWNAATATSRCRLTSYPGEKVTVQGLWRSIASYWTIDHLTFKSLNADPSTEHTVRLSDSAATVIEYCDFIHESGSFASLHITDFTPPAADQGVTVRYCYFKRNDSALRADGGNLPNRDHHIYTGLTPAAAVTTIERNIFEDAPNGDFVKIGASGSTKDGTTNIRYNTGRRGIQAVSLEGTVNNANISKNLWDDVTVDRPAGSSQGAALLAFDYAGTSTLWRDNWSQARVKEFANTGTTTAAEITELTGTGNIFSTTHSPQFLDITVGDYRPQNDTAKAFGRYAA